MEGQNNDYVTVKEAAQRIGYSARQTDRFIKDGELETIRVNRSLRKVSVASIDAFNAKHSRRPVDPLEQIKADLRNQEYVAGDILRQLAAMRQQIEGYQKTVQQRWSEMERQLQALALQLTQEQQARLALEQLVAALTSSGTGEHLSQMLRAFVHHPVRQGQSPQERRGLPPDAIRLTHVAKQHGVEPSTLRHQAEKYPFLATIYQRPNAAVKQREWWVLVEQLSRVTHFWEEHHIPYTPCPQCPHEQTENRADSPEEAQAITS